MDDRGPGKQPPVGWTRLAGMGIELTGAILAFTALGWWIDHSFETAPWGILVGACLGIVGGLYNLIRVALHEALGISKKRGENKPKNEADEK
jgi:F0F1-type ATP synthase assembly protein I